MTWRGAFKQEELLPDSASSAEKAARGLRLERMFFGMLQEASLDPHTSYRPSGEEVDGSFELSNRIILLEAKWRKARQPASALYQFMGKLSGKLVGTLGLFVSISGFSDEAVDALVAGKEINLILMDGNDVRAVVDGRIGIAEAIKIKIRAAAESGTPFVPIADLINLASTPLPTTSGSVPAPDTTKPSAIVVILVEGRLDQRIVQTLLRRYGEPDNSRVVMAASGSRSMAPLAQTLVAAGTKPVEFVVVTDGDGQPSEVTRRLIEDFEDRIPGAEVSVAAVEPSLEVALGVFGANEYAAGRKKVLVLDDSMLSREIERGLRTLSVTDRRALAPLEGALGIELPPSDGQN